MKHIPKRWPYPRRQEVRGIQTRNGPDTGYATAGTRDLGQRMMRHGRLPGDRPMEGEVECGSMQRLNQVQGSLVGLFQDLERVRSQAVRAAQVLSIWIRTALLGVRVCRSEGCLSREQGAHVREDFATGRDSSGGWRDATPPGARQASAGSPQRLSLVVSRTLQRQFICGVGVSGQGEKLKNVVASAGLRPTSVSQRIQTL
jgi:hypothetical protein